MNDPWEVMPADEFNRTLVANVHPSDWKNPAPRAQYDMVVIGGGTAGLVAAAGGAGLGAHVALVERGLLGGDCLNYGCVPSKAILSAARAVGQARAARELGVQTSDPIVDFPAVMQRMRRLRSFVSKHDSAARFQSLGVDVFLGEARFLRPGQVQVGDQTLRYARAVVASGASPRRPEVPGLEDCGFHTSETVFSLTKLPARLAVVGGGPIGCELAQCFARFGSRVHLLTDGDRILPKDDSQAAAVVAAAMARDGVAVLTGGKIVQVERTGSSKTLVCELESENRRLEVDEILVGVGRRPNVERLGLENVGVQYDDLQGIRVDDRLRTTNKRIYAAGDVCSRFQFTHAADAMARIVLQNSLFFGRARASALTIPACTYTQPECARIGLNEAEADKRGVAIRTFQVDFSSVDRAILDGRTEGFLKIHVGTHSDQIVGAAIVADHAGEMISEISLAMTAGIGLGKLASVVHPYPTYAEAIRKAADSFNRTRLSPRVAKLLRTLIAVRRFF